MLWSKPNVPQINTCANWCREHLKKVTRESIGKRAQVNPRPSQPRSRSLDLAEFRNGVFQVETVLPQVLELGPLVVGNVRRFRCGSVLAQLF